MRKWWAILLTCFCICVGSSCDIDKWEDFSEQVSDSLHVHLWDDGVITKQATCMNKGEKTYTCICGECYTEETAFLEHDFHNDICSVCGSLPPSQGLEYALNEDGVSYSVVGIGTCIDMDIVIPFSYNNLLVTAIGEDAFYECDGLTSVTIGNHVTAIEDYAFRDCSGLTSVEIPDSVITIGDWAFTDCDGLTSVEIPNSVITIGDWAFNDCDGLTSVEIPNSVTTIGIGAFVYCDALTSVTIGNHVIAIGERAFDGCEVLENITVHKDNAIYKSVEGNLYSKDGETLIKYADAKMEEEFVIPNGVTTIASWAFAYSRNLTSIVIPDSVTTIGESAFAYCNGLASILIPNSVTTIGEDAFHFCDGLIFYCEPMCEADGWDSTWKMSSCPVIWNYDNNIVATDDVVYAVVDGIRYTVSGDMASVARQAFGIREANIASAITVEGKSYPVTSIEEGAFFSCGRLTSVFIPMEIISIGEYAFLECGDLTIYCERAGRGANWSEKWNIKCPVVWSCKNNDKASDGYIYTIVDGMRYAIKDNKAILLRLLQDKLSVNIPENIMYKNSQYSVTEIAEYAFSYYDNLRQIVIPKSITKINAGAFHRCDRLTNIAVEETNEIYKSIDGNIYSKDGTSFVQYAIGKANREFVIPDSVICIEKYAFADCSRLMNIEIPDSVTTIGYSAFSSCESLLSVVIPSSVISMGDYVFANCESLTSIEIPDGMTSIGNEAFYSCDNLTSVVIPDSVTTIEEWAFAYCESLTSIEIPDSVTTIGDAAFYECDGLTSVVIPNSVTSIGRSVFAYSGLTNIIFKGTVNEWETMTKSDDWNDCLIVTEVVCNDGVVTI